MNLCNRMIDATVGDEIPKGQVIVDMAGMDIAKLGDPRGNHLA